MNIIAILFLCLFGINLAQKPCEEFEFVICTRTMKVILQSFKINIYALKTEYDCNDIYEEEYMTFDLFEICETRNTSKCNENTFNGFTFENCIDLKKNMICSVEKEHTKIGGHDVVRYVETLKSVESNLVLNAYFTITNDTFEQTFTLTGQSSENDCLKSEMNNTQEFSPDKIKVDITGENLPRIYNDSILFFRPRGRVVLSHSSFFSYKQVGEYHITELSSNKTSMKFRLFRWFETSAGELVDTRLDAYEYLCDNVTYYSTSECILSLLTSELEFHTIDFFMNFRLGPSGLLPYDAFIYDPDIRVLFHGIKKVSANPESEKELKKLKLAYFIAPPVVVLVAVAAVIGIIIFIKKRKSRSNIRYNPDSKGVDDAQTENGTTEVSTNQWVVGKVSDDAI